MSYVVGTLTDIADAAALLLNMRYRDLYLRAQKHSAITYNTYIYIKCNYVLSIVMYCIMYSTVLLYCLLCLQTDCQNEGNIISFGRLILRTVRSVCMQLYCDVLRIRPGVASYTEMTNARCFVIYDIYAGTVCTAQGQGFPCCLEPSVPKRAKCCRSYSSATSANRLTWLTP